MTVAIVILTVMLLASGLVVAMGLALARKREAREALVAKRKRERAKDELSERGIGRRPGPGCRDD